MISIWNALWKHRPKAPTGLSNHHPNRCGCKSYVQGGTSRGKQQGPLRRGKVTGWHTFSRLWQLPLCSKPLRRRPGCFHYHNGVTKRAAMATCAPWRPCVEQAWGWPAWRSSQRPRTAGTGRAVVSSWSSNAIPCSPAGRVHSRYLKGKGKHPSWC